MKRKLILAALTLLTLLLLTGCCMNHEWQDATCTVAKTCSKCQETDGEALGHTWVSADCETAETCSVCGETQGEALGHQWKSATCETAETCSVCGETQGEALGHNISLTAVRGNLETNEIYHLGTCADCGETDIEVILSDEEIAEVAANWIASGEWLETYIIRDGTQYEGDRDNSIITEHDNSLRITIDNRSHDTTWKYAEYSINDDGTVMFAYELSGEFAGVLLVDNVDTLVWYTGTSLFYYQHIG